MSADPRVLHVLCDLSGGGAERLVLELARRTGGSVAAVHDGGELEPAFRAAEVDVLRLGRVRGRPGGGALLRATRLARGFDLVHTHLWAGLAWGAPAASLAGVPLVCHEHNIERDEPAWKQWIRRFWLSRASAVIAVSQAVAAAHPGIPSTVVPNGIALERFGAPWIGGDGVLAVGRLVPQKGFDVLARAAGALDGVAVTVAGDGPLRQELAAVAPGIRWIGAVEDVPARLARADVVVVPSRWEGFGLVAVEAMAAGAPVVASRVDGLAELVGDAGILVAPGDSAGLAAAVRRVIGDRALREQLSAAGRARAAGFSLERWVEGIRAVWARALGNDAADRVVPIPRE